VTYLPLKALRDYTGQVTNMSIALWDAADCPSWPAVAGRSVRFPPKGDGRGRGGLRDEGRGAGMASGRPAVGNCGLQLRNRRGRFGVAPARGLGRWSPQRPVAGRSVRFSPTNDGGGQGRWAWGGRQLETAAFGCETARGGWAQPPQGAWQMKPATSSCRAFRAVPTHGRWPRPRGNGARHGRQLKTAAFTCETAGGGWTQPPSGAWQAKPATSSCRAFCVIFTHGRWPRPRGVGLGAAGSWKLRPSLAKPPGAVGRSPRQGAWQTKPATSSCRAFCAISTHGRWVRPRALAPGRPAVGNCGLREAKPPGAVNRSPRQGAWQTKPATSSCRAFCAAPPMNAGRGQGRWAPERPAVENCGLQLRNRQGGWAQPPAGGLANEARNFQLPGVSCGFHPRAMAAAEGVGPGAAGR